MVAEFEQSEATRKALRDHARAYLAGQIAPSNAIELAKSVLSRGDMARAVQASNPTPIKYSSALRRVERWWTSAGEKRAPSKASREQVARVLKENEEAIRRVAGEAPALKFHLDATISINGDPGKSYTRRHTGIVVAFSSEEAQRLLTQALEDPDEAWQTWMDVYVLPASLIEQPRIRFE